MLSRWYDLIDFKALECLVALLIITRLFEVSGASQRIAIYLISRLAEKPKILIWTLLIVAALSAAVAMNDTVLFIYIPIISTTARILEIDLPPCVVLMNSMINLGSSLTPIGNPQNIVIWQRYDVPFISFVVHMLPLFLISIAITAIYLAIVISVKPRRTVVVPKIVLNRKLLIAATAGLVMVVLSIENGLPLLALLISIVTVCITYSKLLLDVDWIIPLMFIFMFLDFNELSELLKLNTIVPETKVLNFLTIVAMCQIISNVPTAVAIKHTDWYVLALATNVGGVGILYSSLANIITLRLSKISIKDFHKYAIPYFLLLLTITSTLLSLNIF